MIIGYDNCVASHLSHTSVGVPTTMGTGQRKPQ